MMNGLSLGVGVFCFVLMGFCLYLATKMNYGLNFGLAIINGLSGILNFWIAFR